MEQKKLSKGKNIPTTLSGGFYYLAQSTNKAELEATLKKLGKSKTKIVMYEIPKEKGLFAWLLGSKVGSKVIYVAYKKD